MFKKYKEKFIGDREFYANLIRLIIPMIVQQGITSFVSLLDNVMVGRLGTESMSGVAIVNQLLFVFNLTIFGGLAGASIFGAQFYGKGDHKGVRYALRFKLIFSVLMAVIAIVALLFFNNPLISLFLTESESGGDLVLTLSEAKNYLFVMLIGLIPFSFSQSYSSTLRETGETVSPMTASIIAIVTNFVLNYILIFGSFGAPRLGVVGAAIATVIARYIEAIYLILHTHRREKTFIFAQGLYKSLYLPGAVVKKILLTGTPLMLNELFWSIGTTMISQSYSTRGLTVVAATNIAGTVWNLFCVIMFAMGNAVSIGVGALIAITAPFIPLIYNTTPEVQRLTTELLLVAGAALPIQAFAHVTYFTIRSGGKTFITFLFDCVFTWLIPLPIAFFCSRYTALSIIGIYALVQFADIIKVIIGSILLRSGIWANNVVSDVD